MDAFTLAVDITVEAEDEDKARNYLRDVLEVLEEDYEIESFSIF